MARTLPGTFFYEAWMCPGGLTAACSLTTPGVAREMGDMLLYGDLPSLLESSLVKFEPAAARAPPKMATQPL